MAEVTEKAIKKAIKRRFDHMKAHRHELTLRQTRRLLEEDLQLPEKALDAEPYKGLIKHQVDEIMRLLVALEVEAEGAAAVPGAAKAASLKRVRDEPVANEPPKLGSSARALALKAMLKRATIPIPPAFYRSADGSEENFCSALERALAQAGLRLDSTDSEVADVRRRRELARDLDGIDAKNVVETERGRPRRTDAATASYMHVARGAVGGSGAADDEREATTPAGRRRKLRLEDWEDDDEA